MSAGFVGRRVSVGSLGVPIESVLQVRKGLQHRLHGNANVLPRWGVALDSNVLLPQPFPAVHPLNL